MNRFLIALLLVAVLTPAADAQRGRRDRPVVFKVGKIYVGNNEVISPGMVLVKSGKIVAVGKTVDVPAGAVTVDRSKWTMTPGLIDAAAEGFGNSTEAISEVVPGFKISEGLNLHAKHLYRIAKGGVTTAFVTASTSAVIGAQGCTVKTGRKGRVLDDSGDPKVTLSQTSASGNRGPSRFSGITVYTRRPTSQMGIIFVARDALTKARNRAAALKDGKKLPANPHMDVLNEVLAGKRGMRIRGEEQYELSAGLRLAEEFGFKPIFEQCVEAWRVTDSLKKQGASVVMGPVIPPPAQQGRRRFGPPPSRRSPGGAALVAKAGVPLALTAGSGSGENGLARQAAYAVRHGLSRIDAVKATTSTPAALLGIDKTTGMIKTGYDADFVLWTGEPFSATSRPGMVMIDGSVVDGRAF